MTNLLLIDSLVRDQQTVINSLTHNTQNIVVDFFQDNLQTIRTKITALDTQFINFGLFQENDDKPFYQFIRCFNHSILHNVQNQDPELNTWTEFIDLLSFLKNDYGMLNFDIMDCNIASNSNWNYVINQIQNKLNINIHASINETGNTAMNGDWILEQGNINLIGLYFTDDIKNYKYTLGGGGSNAIHSLIIGNDSNVYACGWNQDGQLGIILPANTKILNSMKLPINLNPGVVPIKVACGSYHTVVLFSDGSVYACGSNSGQLGINSRQGKNVLTQMVDSSDKKITGAINIACGTFHTVVLFSDGSVYACGLNMFGQLGINSTVPKNVLTQMVDSSDKKITGAINIACGSYHTVVLFSDGSVYACGYNYYGQLGINSVDYNHITLQPMSNLPEGKFASNIACGAFHTVVLFSDKTVYACGDNQYGQLGIGSTIGQSSLQPMIDLPEGKFASNIACGFYYTVVLFSDGSVYACGFNKFGQLGINKTLNEVEYKNVLTQMVNSSDKEITDAINIACGASHTVVLFSDGSVYACGDNQSGQLGINSTQQQITLQPMLYAPNNTNFNIASIAVFCVIFLDLSKINIQEKYNGTGNYNINLLPSTYNIYTYIPGQPEISIINSDVIFENKNIGTHKATINIIQIQIQDTTTNTNYVYVNSYITRGTITLAPLTIMAGNQSTDYGTELNLGTNGFTSFGLKNGDTVTSVTIKYNTITTVPSTTNAGTYDNSLIPSNPIGTGLSNYNFIYINGTLKVKPITLIGTFSNTNKTYDGNTNTLNTFNFTPINLIVPDTTNITNLAGQYDTKNILATTINIISGTSSNQNYLFNIKTTSGSITQAILTPIFTSIPKIYDQKTNANVIYTLNGLILGDIILLSYNANYLTPDAGTNKQIDITNISINPNTYSNNYELAYTSTEIYDGVIILSNLSNFINKYTNINDFKKINVIKINNNAYGVLYIQNKIFAPILY